MITVLLCFLVIFRFAVTDSYIPQHVVIYSAVTASSRPLIPSTCAQPVANDWQNDRFIKFFCDPWSWGCISTVEWRANCAVWAVLSKYHEKNKPQYNHYIGRHMKLVLGLMMMRVEYPFHNSVCFLPSCLKEHCKHKNRVINKHVFCQRILYWGLPVYI